ncbi:hypothetical protein, partial [Lactiplantibacillus plantarum]|uniref:hypothetical protein n=1 Tax=Lactiplantibacillus plantarum TaxID=1590 RepID=UPI0021A3306A
FLFSIISKAGLEKSEDFSRPALFLETYVTASFFIGEVSDTLNRQIIDQFRSVHNVSMLCLDL